MGGVFRDFMDVASRCFADPSSRLLEPGPDAGLLPVHIDTDALEKHDDDGNGTGKGGVAGVGDRKGGGGVGTKRGRWMRWEGGRRPGLFHSDRQCPCLSALRRECGAGKTALRFRPPPRTGGGAAHASQRVLVAVRLQTDRG